MRKERQLVLHTILFGKVIAYKCTACDKTFLVSDGAVSTDSSPPAVIRNAFLRHMCEERANWPMSAARRFYAIRYRCLELFMDDDDVPASYLLYVVAVVVVMGLVVAGVFFYFFR